MILFWQAFLQIRTTWNFRFRKFKFWTIYNSKIAKLWKCPNHFFLCPQLRGWASVVVKIGIPLFCGLKNNISEHFIGLNAEKSKVSGQSVIMAKNERQNKIMIFTSWCTLLLWLWILPHMSKRWWYHKDNNLLSEISSSYIEKNKY